MKYNGEEVSAQTDSIQEVLLEQEQKYLKTNGVFTVEYNGRSFTVVLGRAQSLRCFRNKIAALSLENRFKLALNVTD